jgi:DNA repair exonuclease SbcCD ATPase subunit
MSDSLLADYREKTDKLLADLRAAHQQFKQEQKIFAREDDEATNAEEAQKVLQLVAQTVQQQAHDRIAGVVSRCLEAVFDEPYNFKILFEQKRGRTEARLVFERDGNEVDPMTASGGGVVDVAAFALRISCLMLSKPPVRRVLICDEPLKFLSAEYQERAAEMIEKLAKDLGIQVIMVTHIEAFKIGTVIQL